MDFNDRARDNGSSQRRQGRRGPRGGGGGGGGSTNTNTNAIKGPHSALTDYLQEIGVSEHFRNRRREQEEALRQQVAQAAAAGPNGAAAGGQEGVATQATASSAPGASASGGSASTDNADDSADRALAADLQQEENEAADMAGASGSGSSSRATLRTRSRTAAAAAAAVSSSVIAVPAAASSSKGKGKGKSAKKGKGKKGRDSDSEYESDGDNYADAAGGSGGLNRGSARKGGKMKDCEVCSRRFLLRGELPADGRLLCTRCRQSIDRSASEHAAVAKNARAAIAAAAGPPKRKRLKKTEGGLLEYDRGIPTLQDICVRAIAKNIDQVESFGEITAQSANKVCRIISKMRILDETTLGLFLGGGEQQESVTLYDCTKIAGPGIRRLVDGCPNVTSLRLEYCGQLNRHSLLDIGCRLRHLTSVRLDGAFLINSQTWAEFFLTMGPRLQSFKVKYAGFGPPAMRALVTHCKQLRELRVSECVDFDDDCLAMLAIPITEHEEHQQEAERAKRSNTNGEMGSVGWEPMACLESLELGHPHQSMTNQSAVRAIETVGSQLRILDLTGFRDINDDFLLKALDGNCGRLRELYLGECNSISADAFAEFFARQRRKRGARKVLQGHGGKEQEVESEEEECQRISSSGITNGLVRVGLDRCYMLTDRVLQELVMYSGASLTWLGLNSVDDNLTLNGLLALAGKMDDRGAHNQTSLREGENEAGGGGLAVAKETGGCINLEELDVSFVRCASDSVLSVVLAKCKRLAQISVYGCPEVTSLAPARSGLAYVGRECDTL
ncbi:UV-damaged DNA-binding protein rad7 [Coemansia sp. RSA 2049]|nr:UV-damaged DNA-binding protein rad7 [Coemansia sp. RSA 2049]